MTFRKKTLRNMSPTTRKMARTLGEVESAVKRLKKLIPIMGNLEARSDALSVAKSETMDCEKVIYLEPNIRDSKALLVALRNAIDGADDLQGGQKQIPISVIRNDLSSAIKLLNTPVSLKQILE